MKFVKDTPFISILNMVYRWYPGELADIEESPEHSSFTLFAPMANNAKNYQTILEDSMKELLELIREIRSKKRQFSEISVSLKRFADERKLLLLSAGEKEFLAECTDLPRCFYAEVTEAMQQIKDLGDILYLGFDEDAEIIPLMLEHVRFNMYKLKIAHFLSIEEAAGEIRAGSAGNQAFQELEESLLERDPISMDCYDTIMESRDDRIRDCVECSCWKCALGYVDRVLSQ